MTVTQGAAGKVATGFSFPWVAKYSESAGEITFTDAMELARGVDVSIDVDEPSDNDFWANNQMAESAPGKFTGGTANLTVDGLLMPARRLIQGLPTTAEDGWTAVGDTAQAPYVAIGYIVRFMSGNVESWTPTILVKTKFNPFADAAATEDQGEIDWQTQALTAKIFRGDNATHDWCWIGSDFATEAEALAAMKTKLGVQG